jgi:hypothetical protein
MLTTPLLARPTPKPPATRPFRPPHCPWPRCDTRPRAPFRYYLKRPELLVPVAAGLGPPREPLVYDDFETFFGAQDFAVGLGTAVGQPLTTPAPAAPGSRRAGPHPGA